MKKRIILALIAFQLSFITSAAKSAEITAIDFAGKIIGKVLPDGKTINLENNIIGQINADSQIINPKGEIIGGIIPQGIAIGNDFKVLGRPSQDGKVISPSGAIVGSVLPNSLVVNDGFDVIGAVLFPGIVYSNNGQYVGRLTGDGLYTDMQGNLKGFITPDGYAYKKTGDSHILDGRLILTKMAVSLQGELLGSLNPQGDVLGFDNTEVGKINANGFVTDKSNKVVAQLVNNSYAYDFLGNPTGFISYDGKVTTKDSQKNRITYNNIIINEEKEPVGFSLPQYASATDLKGGFLGLVQPDGIVAKGTETKGRIGPKGVVIDSKGNVIGKVIKTGPVFDYKAQVVSHALFNGKTYNLGGTENGYIKDKHAHNLRGVIVGSVYTNKAMFSSDNQFLGISGIDNKLVSSDKKLLASEQGLVFDGTENISGQALELDFLYNKQGNLLGSISPQGVAHSFIGQTLGGIVGLGYISNDLNNIVAKAFSNSYINSLNNKKDLLLTTNGLLYNKDNKLEAKALPDSSVVSTSAKNSVEYMPVIGRATSQLLVVSYKGSVVGYVDYDGSIKDFTNNKLGVVTEPGVAVDFNNIPIGELVATGVVLDNNCLVIGVADTDGSAKSLKDVLLGKIYPKGFVISEGVFRGYIPKLGAIINHDGLVEAFGSNNGQYYNTKKEALGCSNLFGKIVKENILLGSVINFANAINFENKIIGRSILDGNIVDSSSKNIGYLQPDNNINSTSGKPIAILQEYRYAFDNENKFIGLINKDAKVIDKEQNYIGSLYYDGSIVKDGNQIGYALYDLYLYDATNTPVAYIDLSGRATDFYGKQIGKVENGFLADADNKLVARPNRDYNIRDEDKVVIGKLTFDNNVYDKDGSLVGQLNAMGEIINALDKTLAIAKPLQYYNKVKSITGKNAVVNEKGEIIGYVSDDGKVYDKEGNIIGTKDKNGKVSNKEGQEIGKVLGGQKVYNKEGVMVGTTRSDGIVEDSDGKVIGKLNDKGELISPNGEVLGGIGPDWYKKIDAPKNPEKSGDLPQLDSYIRSISIALTPDGKYLGEILEDGSVIDKDGNILGKSIDGLVVNQKGDLIGVQANKEDKGTSKTTKEEVKSTDMFMPGATGSGNPYGVGNGNTNAGPGGGYGPGERYDPTRVRALAMAQAARSQSVSVKSVNSTYNPSSFDYKQDKWEGVSSDLSSWRVDMSEMILADKPIPAVLARSIYNTSTDVPVTAYVERNVYSEEGRNIIIPSGSRLIGKVNGFGSAQGGSTNAAKVQITWDRLIRPDGSMFKLAGSVTGDGQGRQGALGYVDRNLMQRYLSPIIFSVATSASSYFMATDEETDGETESSKQQAANDARENFLQSMDQVFGDVLNNALEDAEIIFVPAGTRVIVYPNKDLWLRSPERDQDQASFQDKNNGPAKSLVDDGNKTGETGGSSSSGGNNSQSSGANNSQVVYDNDANAEAQSGGTPLLSSGTNKSSQTTTPQAIVTPPPPPPSSSAATPTPPSSSSSSSAPVLF